MHMTRQQKHTKHYHKPTRNTRRRITPIQYSSSDNNKKQLPTPKQHFVFNCEPPEDGRRNAETYWGLIIIIFKLK
jgi:hypothetical protein